MSKSNQEITLTKEFDDDATEFDEIIVLLDKTERIRELKQQQIRVETKEIDKILDNFKKIEREMEIKLIMTILKNNGIRFGDHRLGNTRIYLQNTDWMKITLSDSLLEFTFNERINMSSLFQMHINQFLPSVEEVFVIPLTFVNPAIDTEVETFGSVDSDVQIII